jgi:hypothetical protein
VPDKVWLRKGEILAFMRMWLRAMLAYAAKSEMSAAMFVDTSTEAGKTSFGLRTGCVNATKE